MPKRTRDEVEDPKTYSAQSSPTVRICVGSYEHVLYGIDANIQTTADATGLQVHFNPVYMFEAHTAQIKACAIGGRYLASGGVDEVLRIYDLKGRRDLGNLLSHDGSITTIKFSGNHADGSVTHMLSGDENNRIIIWRCKDWTPLIQLTTRHGTVNDLSIHPSGKICVSVGRDRNVRLWNLVTGKKAAAFKLGREEPLKIQWNQAGDAYAILFDTSIRIYDMSAALQHSFPADRTRFHDLCWFTAVDGRELLLASQDNGAILVLDPSEKSVLQTLTGHKTRVKAISVQNVVVPQGHSQVLPIIVSGSTDGDVLVWANTKPKDVHFSQIGKYNCGECRITCLASCDAAIESLESIVKRRLKLEPKSDESDIDIKEEEDEEQQVFADAAESDDSDEAIAEEEFTGFD